MWQNSSQLLNNQQQQQNTGLKGMSGGIHGKQPMLMANNDVFSIGPYKARKDRSRISVLHKYEIIGYIAAGTYGKVYKVKRKANYIEPANNNTKGITNFLDMQVDTKPVDLKSDRNEVSLTNGKSNYLEPTLQNPRQNDNIDVDVEGSNLKNELLIGYQNTYNTSPLHNSNTFKKKPVSKYFAIKKFKTEREGYEQQHYTGISQSACREMALCREVSNNHLTQLVEIFMEKKSIYMVYDYAEHDLLQIIHFHSHPEKRMIPQRMIRSIMWQILDGVSYLHQNWILHRDLKPANIMVTSSGCVKVGDLGLARKFHNMLQTLYTGDKVVVTIWYRAPELMIGARHYTPAIDLWAVGCIFAELIGLQPIFKGEEAKMDSKKSVPFQANQLQRIIEVLGSPSQKYWPNINKYPEYDQLSKFQKCRDSLPIWYHSAGGRDKHALDLLYQLFKYDPTSRIDAMNALDHDYFTNGDYPVCESVFEGLNYKYPARRIHTSDNDIMNIGQHKSRVGSQQQQTTSNSASTATLGGLGVNRRILAAAAAAAAVVSGNGSNGQTSLRKSEPSRKKRR